jgi:hypothetical protein
MKAVNNKSLLSFVFDQMDKLNENLITVEQAKAQANLAKQANNCLRYELDLVKTKIQVTEFNMANGLSLELRNAESKNFE